MSNITLTKSEINSIANPSRRRFLKLGAGALSALIVLEIGGVGLLYLQPRQAVNSFGSVMVAGDVSEFPAGSVTEFINGRFFLVRTQDGGFLALYRRCPHLGCIINWNNGSEEFICPCHASSFDIHGNYNNTLIPRPLDMFVVTVEGEKVMVDISQRHQREQFTPAQLTYADL